MAILARFEKDFTDEDGNVLTGNVSVTVTLEGGGVVPLYDGRDSATAGLLGNPFINDGGAVAFHCAGGAYRIDVTQGALTRTLRYVGIGRAQESDGFVRAGGTAGQVLKKASGTDYDTEWGNGGGSAVSVKDYGAVGDGTTDDSGAIQDAIDAMAALSLGGTVFFPDGAGEVYAIDAALVWKPKVNFLAAPGAVIKATASMNAMLATGTGSGNRIKNVTLEGGHWDCNFLASRSFHVKDAQTVRLSRFAAYSCGAYVDGSSESLTAYVEVGDASQSSACFEIEIEDFVLQRARGAASPTAVPAQNYGIYSGNDAADSYVDKGIIRSVKKGMYGEFANWVISRVHPWNYDPEDGPLEIAFHAISHGNVSFIENYADLYSTASIGFKIEGDSTPSRLIGNTVLCGANGTDNSGSGIQVGSGVVLQAIGNSVLCLSASNRLAAAFSGTLTGVTVIGQKNANVVANGVGPHMLRDQLRIDQNGTQSGMRLDSGSYSTFLTVYSSGSAEFSSNASFAILTGSGFVTGIQQLSSGLTQLHRGISLGGPVTKTADFTLGDTEHCIINNKTGSTCVATLPAASSWLGRRVRFKNTQAQQLTSASSNVVPKTGGAAGTAILPATSGAWAELESDGTNWVIMASGT